MLNVAGRTVTLPVETAPIIDEADVVVVGGGTSGFIAATAAARTGARVILVERFGYLGGCTTAPYNTNLGWFFDSDKKQIIQGIPWEFIERMQAIGDAYVLGPSSPQIWPPMTKKVAMDMVLDAGVELYFYSWVSSVLPENGVIKGIVVQNKGGRSVILGKTFVDASGDADLTAFAGGAWEMTETDDLQQVSIDYIACGVNAEKVIAWAHANPDKITGLRGAEFENKEYGSQPMFTFVIPNATTKEDGEGKVHHVGVMPTVKLCIYREAVRIQGNADINPLDPKALTQAEVVGMQGALEHLTYLKDNVDGFQGAFVVAQAHPGVRETRRIIGDYMISIDDLHNQARFDDVVCLNARALDYHLKGTVFKISNLKGNHDVPYRALTPQGVENLLVAGRSISCDHLAQASIRGAATCMATGHAAGTAAALAAQGNGRTRDVDIRLLQEMLLKQNAILSTEGRDFGVPQVAAAVTA